jgi:aryl-alcohol dehydrogenase-like predicted oxidoreductase
VSLPTERLGTTDMTITRVGFGAWAIGGGDWAYGWGPQDDDESIASIRHAVELGVNWIDTAAAYGLGHSEEIVSRTLRDLPDADRPYVFTKCGLVWDNANRRAAPRRVAAPASLRREADDSLRRLGVDRIDLLQLHVPPDDGTPLDDYWATLVALRDEGKIAAAGLSNHDVKHLEAAEQIGHVDSVQPPFSAIQRDAGGAEIPWCRAHSTGVIVYSPMQSGLLTGSFSRDRAKRLPANDWRSGHPYFTGDGLDRNLALAGFLGQVAQRRGVPTAAVAVAWALAWPGVTGAIVGARRAEQVDGWLPGADLTLSEADQEEIAAAIDRTGAGRGPARPTARDGSDA